jgi:hypothetical protein
VLWLKGRSIRRAFEVEHTTSIYSGLLRMADLLALQPNMDIRLHIVAPDERRDKVFAEIRRPVFSLLERGPLSESCTFVSYESVRELAKEGNLEYLSDRCWSAMRRSLRKSERRSGELCRRERPDVRSAS